MPGLVGDHILFGGRHRARRHRHQAGDRQPLGRPPSDANGTPIPPIPGIEYGASGIVKVDIAHLNKFKALVLDGPGAHGLYGPDPDTRDTGTTRRPGRPGSHHGFQQPHRPEPAPPRRTRQKADNTRSGSRIGFRSDAGARNYPPRHHALWPSYRAAEGRDTLHDDEDEFPRLRTRKQRRRFIAQYGRRGTKPFEPDPDDDTDTYFHGLLDPDEITRTLQALRTRYNEPGLLPPPADNLRIEPEPATPITVPDRFLTLIDTDGNPVIVRPDTAVHGYSDPAKTDVRADYLIRVDGVQHRVREDLIRDFTWNPGTATLTPRPDTSGVRFVDNNGHPVKLTGGRKVTATPLPGDRTAIRNPSTGNHHTIEAAVAKAAGLGGLKRSTGPLFRNGIPSTDDPRQGALGDCDLIEPMKNHADQHPNGIVTMVRAYDNNTYAVLFIIDGEPVWKRVTSDLYVDADGHTLHAHHQDGDPLWPAIIEKARAALRGQQDIDSEPPAPRLRYNEAGLRPPPPDDLPISPEPAAVVTVSDELLTLIDDTGTPVVLGDDTDVYRDQDPAATKDRDDGHLPPHQRRPRRRRNIPTLGPRRSDGRFHLGCRPAS